MGRGREGEEGSKGICNQKPLFTSEEMESPKFTAGIYKPALHSCMCVYFLYLFIFILTGCTLCLAVCHRKSGFMQTRSAAVEDTNISGENGTVAPPEC